MALFHNKCIFDNIFFIIILLIKLNNYVLVIKSDKLQQVVRFLDNRIIFVSFCSMDLLDLGFIKSFLYYIRLQVEIIKFKN